MKMIGAVIRYLRYYIRSSSINVVHSPFIYKFYSDVLIDKNNYPEYTVVEKRRREMRRNKRLLSVFDMGAGNERKKESFKRVRSIIKKSATAPSRGQLLFRITKYFQPTTIVELGTSMGMSTMYLSLGAPKSKIYTVEGCSNLSSVAESNFRKVKLSNINLHIGNFDYVLPEILKKVGRIDLLFIDGDHKKEKLLDYFEQCMEYAGNDSVFIFDDIHWSKQMEEAWDMIKNDKRVKVSIDLFHLGILFFKSELSEESFVLKV